MMRKVKGKPSEGLVAPGEWLLITAQRVYEKGWATLEKAFRHHFPWLFESGGKPKPRCKSRKPVVPALRGTVLDYVI
jgi:hypothetical protein